MNRYVGSNPTLSASTFFLQVHWNPQSRKLSGFFFDSILLHENPLTSTNFVHKHDTRALYTWRDSLQTSSLRRLYTQKRHRLSQMVTVSFLRSRQRAQSIGKRSLKTNKLFPNPMRKKIHAHSMDLLFFAIGEVPMSLLKNIDELEKVWKSYAPCRSKGHSRHKLQHEAWQNFYLLHRAQIFASGIFKKMSAVTGASKYVEDCRREI